MTAASPIEWALGFCFGAMGAACLVFAVMNLVETLRKSRRGGGW